MLNEPGYVSKKEKDKRAGLLEVSWPGLLRSYLGCVNRMPRHRIFPQAQTNGHAFFPLKNKLPCVFARHPPPSPASVHAFARASSIRRGVRERRRRLPSSPNSLPPRPLRLRDDPVTVSYRRLHRRRDSLDPGGSGNVDRFKE